MTNSATSLFARLRQLGLESFIYGIGGILSRFIGVFLLPFYTRALTPSDYGELSLVTTSTLLFGIVTGMSLADAAARWYWDVDTPEQQRSVISTWLLGQLGTTIIAACVMLLLSPQLGQLLIATPDAAVYFRLAAPCLVLNRISQAYVYHCRLKRQPGKAVMMSVLTLVTQVIGGVIFVVFLRMGVIGALLGQLIAAALTGATGYLLLRTYYNLKYFTGFRFREMLGYSLPLVPAAACAWILASTDQYFLRYFLTTHEVGLYSIGLRVAGAIAVIVTGFMQAYGAFAFSIADQPDSKRVYAAVLTVYTVICCTACTALCYLSEPLLNLLAPQEYLGAVQVVGIVAFSVVVGGITQVVGLGVNMAKTNRPILAGLILAAAVNLPLNYFCLQFLGWKGVAIATLAARAVVPAYVLWASQQQYRIPYQTARVIIILMYCLLTLYVHQLTGSDGWVIRIVAFTGYFPLLFLLRIVSFESVLHGLLPRLSAALGSSAR